MALALALASALVASACGDEGGDEASALARGQPLRVVTTVSPITSIVAGVAGDMAVVTGLVPEGTNSHTFEPPPSAARVLEQADVVFINGLGLEEPTKQLAEKNLKDGAEIVELGSETVSPDEYIYDFSFPKDEGKPNPHLWTDPPMAKQFARVTADTLARRDPASAHAYEANYLHFAAKANELDRAVVAATSTLPPGHRKLLTYHDAYAYFAKRYGWTVIGAIQPSTFAEPTA